MRHFGIRLTEGSKVENLTVAQGTSFPSNPNPGELFYRTDTDTTIRGLYIYVDNWTRISTQEQLVTPSGTGLPDTPDSTQGSLFFLNSNDSSEGLYYYDAVDGWALVRAGGTLGVSASSANSTFYPTFTSSVSGSLVNINVNTGLNFNPSTGLLKSTIVNAGSLTIGSAQPTTISNVGADLLTVQNSSQEYTTLQLSAPAETDLATGNRETVLRLNREDASADAEYLDLYNKYFTSSEKQYGIRINKRGSGEYRPFVIDLWDGTNPKIEALRVTSSNVQFSLPITSGTWNGTAIGISYGGTGATDAATARTNLGLAVGSDVQAWDADLDAIAALAGTSGLLRKTGANTWSLDTATYLTGNQTITITGDADGTGTTTINITLDTVNSNVGAFGSASSVATFTVNGKGLITAAGSTAIDIAASQVSSGTFADARIASSNVTQHQALLSIAETQITNGTLLARVGDNETVTGTWVFNNPVSVGTPTADGHAATKLYVDNLAAGINPHAAVKAATTGNITLSGTQTIDGVALIAGDRVLVKDQSTASQNGVYIVAAGAWSRATDFDGSPSNEVTTGDLVFVDQGTTNGDTSWVLITSAPITVGTTALTFSIFSRAADIVAGAGLTRTANTIDVGTASASRIVVNADSIDLATTGVSASTYRSVTVDVYGRVTAGTNPTTLAGYGITDAQGLDADLTALANTTTTGIYTVTGAGTSATRTLQQPAAGITISNPAGLLGDPTFALANDLAAVEGLATTGIVRRTGTDTWSAGTAVSLTTEVTGVLPVANGGTNLSAIGTANQVLGVNTGGTALEYKTIAAGTAISVTPTAGTLTIANTGATSVTLTQPAAGITITNTGVAQTGATAFTFALSADLAAVEGIATTGVVKRTAANTWTAAAVDLATADVAGVLPIANGGTNANSAATARTNLGLAIGTNVQAWDADLDAIAALAGTSGLLRKTAANTWSLDTATYLTGNQTITLSGDVTGTGSTAITTTLANTAVTAGSYGSASSVATFDVNSQGRLTAAATTSIAIAASQVTSGTFADARIAASNVTQHQASLTILESQITDGTILSRNAGNETITGTWIFNNPIVIGPSAQTFTDRFEIQSTANTTAVIYNYGNNANTGQLAIIKSRGANVSDRTIVNTDDVIGFMSFQATDGTQNLGAAVIRGALDGAPGTGSMPGKLSLLTTASGASNATERMRINNAGYFTFGDEHVLGTVRSVVPRFQFVSNGTSPELSQVLIRANRANNGGGGLIFAKSRGATSASFTTVQDGDQLGNIIFAGSNGVDLSTTGAEIVSLVDGTPTSTNVPAKIVFRTNSTGNTPTERMAIAASGAVSIGGQLTTGSLVVGSSTSIREWTAADTDIDALLPGTTFGTIVEGQSVGHLVLGVRSNDASDSFSIVTRSAFGSTYDLAPFTVSALGNVTMGGASTTTTTISNQLRHGPTVSAGETPAAGATGTLDSFATATYRSAHYQVQITQSTTYEHLQLHVVHDGTNAFVAEFGRVSTSGTPTGVVFDASISTGTLSVTWSGGAAGTTIKARSTLIDV